jgi:hypothetical protein
LAEWAGLERGKGLRVNGEKVLGFREKASNQKNSNLEF